MNSKAQKEGSGFCVIGEEENKARIDGDAKQSNLDPI
jgi:hypothetical protein